MLSIKIKSLTLLIAFSFALPAWAGEGGEGAAAGGKAPEKQEHSPAVEYVEKTTKLNTIHTRINDAQKDFDKLVEEKDAEKDPKKKDEIIKEMIDLNKRRNKDIEDYNRLLQEVLYQYPAKNAELKSMYDTQEKKGVDEMQSTADIDDLLTRIKKVIQKKFAPFDPANDKPKPSSIDGKDARAKNAEAPKKLRLEK